MFITYETLRLHSGVVGVDRKRSWPCDSTLIEIQGESHSFIGLVLIGEFKNIIVRGTPRWLS